MIKKDNNYFLFKEAVEFKSTAFFLHVNIITLLIISFPI